MEVRTMNDLGATIQEMNRRDAASTQAAPMTAEQFDKLAADPAVKAAWIEHAKKMYGPGAPEPDLSAQPDWLKAYAGECKAQLDAQNPPREPAQGNIGALPSGLQTYADEVGKQRNASGNFRQPGAVALK
jgi:hypothetical protein